MNVDTAARAQLFCGIVDAWVMAAVMWAVCGTLGGALTASWLGSLGGIAGWMACGLLPFGWLEIVLALQARASGDSRQVRRLARLQVASVCIGGVTSALIGAWILRALRA